MLQRLHDKDRLNMLTDDILRLILKLGESGCKDKCALYTVHASALGLLPDLGVDVKDFLSVPHPKPIEVKYMENRH